MVLRSAPSKRLPEQDDPLTRKIIACAIEVHKRLGPGLLEKLYWNIRANLLENILLIFWWKKKLFLS